MSAFLQPSYWFTMSPPEVGGLLGNIVLGIFVLVLVLGIIGRIVVDRPGSDKYKREIGIRLASLFTIMGLLGVILFFFSFEEIQLFGARFWYPLWIIAVGVWVFFIIRFVQRDVPLKRAREQSLREQAKYLPKSHGR